LLDTVGLQSGFITEKLAQKIENEMILKEATDMKTGANIYRFTNLSLMGSFDNRIQVKIKRDDWVLDKNFRSPTKQNCLPYLIIEGSLHKAILGHNCFGGPTSIHSTAAGLVDIVSKGIGIELPIITNWSTYRIDVSECYDLIDFDVVQEWFRGLNNAQFTRRKVNRYNTTGLYAPGTTTALKFYAKGAEFYKHDRKILIKSGHRALADEIQVIANKLVRVEVEIKKKKLITEFENCNIMNIDDKKLQTIYDVEVNRLLKEGKSDMNIVRTTDNVKRRLFNMYTLKQASLLMGFWFMLTIQGEEVIKKQYKQSTYYRNTKLLRDAGISFLNTDVQLKEESKVPYDFSPVRSDHRRIVSISEKMAAHELVYRELVRQAI
jgi:II/X family phage/plasmid replication protein